MFATFSILSKMLDLLKYYYKNFGFSFLLSNGLATI